MITIKAAIRAGEISGSGKANVKVRVTKDRKSRFIPTGIYIDPNFWVAKKGRIKETQLNAPIINFNIQKEELKYQERLLKIENPHTLDINRLKDLLMKDPDQIANPDFLEKMKEIIQDFKDRGSRTWIPYQTTYNALVKYNGFDKLKFQEIDRRFLRRFENYLIAQKKKTNYISIHLRNIRKVYNDAITDGEVPLGWYPFRGYEIATEETKKRNLTIEEMRRLIDVQLTGKLEFSRDVVLLSFFFIGMNMVDLYYLEPQVGERIEFTRAKTHRGYSIKIEPEAKKLVEKYRDPKGDRMFIFHRLYSNHQNFMKAVNKFLKNKVVKLDSVNIKKPVTTYYMRHTWATFARSNGISKDDIRLSLGHGPKTVTDIYIDEDLDIIDRANRVVLNAVFSYTSQAQNSEQ